MIFIIIAILNQFHAFLRQSVANIFISIIKTGLWHHEFTMQVIQSTASLANINTLKASESERMIIIAANKNNIKTCIKKKKLFNQKLKIWAQN